MADASQNKPKKEFTYALVGTVVFLALVLLIAISAFLRPAGNHVTPKPAVEEMTEKTTADTTVQTAITPTPETADVTIAEAKDIAVATEEEAATTETENAIEASADAVESTDQ